MRRLAIMAGAVALAALAGTHAVGTAGARFNPELAIRAMPHNGEARARLSVMRLEQMVQDGAVADPASAARAIRGDALAAFAAEPTSALAVRQLGLAAELSGDRDRAVRLMQLAGQLSKREDGVNMWLIDHNLRKGDLAAALDHYDRVLRSSSAYGPLLTARLAQGLVLPAMVDPLADVLARRPRWSREFWLAATAMPPALINAARLRMILARAGVAADPDIDMRLMGGLSRQQNFTEAEQLYTALRKGGAGKVLLSEAEWAREPALPPFDWGFAGNGLQSAAVAPRERAMVLSGAPGSEGVAAYRVLAMEPGAYDLAMTLDGDAGPVRPAAAFQIACVQPAGAPLVRLAEAGGRIAGQFVVAAGCRYHRVELRIAVPQDSATADVTVSKISLRRL